MTYQHSDGVTMTEPEPTPRDRLGAELGKVARKQSKLAASQDSHATVAASDDAKLVSDYLAVKARVEAECNRIAAELNRSPNQVLTFAIVDLHQRLQHLREHRVLISVPPGFEIYNSTLELRLFEADPVYGESFEALIETIQRSQDDE